jgi:hypothetical protein
MPTVRFVPTIPVFELAKMFHALERAAIVICLVYVGSIIISDTNRKS